GAVRVSLPARRDRRLAARARAPGAAVDPAIALLPLDRRPHQPVRALEDVAKLRIRDLADGAPRRDANLPQGLRTPDVPDPGTDARVEQRVAHGTTGIVGTKRREHSLEVGRLGEDVRPESQQAARVQLEHGPPPEHRLPFRAAEHEPRPPRAAG